MSLFNIDSSKFSKNGYVKYFLQIFSFLFSIHYQSCIKKLGIICAILTSYCFHILEINITDEDSSQSRNVSLKLLFFSFMDPKDNQPKC